MRPALLTLIGFVAFTLCPSLCPMSADTMAMDTSMSHEMPMAHHDMQHESEEAPCEHCDVNAEIELALTSTDSVTDAPLAVTAFIAFSANTFDYIDTGIPKSHLAATGPPVVPEIVRTIVLRT